MDLPGDLELDVGLRFYGGQPNPEVPGYLEADARLGWNVSRDLEVSLTGFNMLNDHHPESGAYATRSEIRRGMMAGVRWKF
jgi:iron complex outermembrane receptor protein